MRVLASDARRASSRSERKFSLVCGDQRHDCLNEKHDETRKHGQRESFINTRAANHRCHGFPHPESDVTLDCFGE